jgi:hypothetical protein
MQQNSTNELLVKHLYNETNSEQITALNQALAEDALLQVEFNQLQETKYALDEAGDELPSASVIEKIKAFSKSQELTATH